MLRILADVGYQSNWTEVLGSGFMRNAFIGGTLVAIASGLIGYFVVIRRDAFAAHALAHIGFPGATFAVLVGISVTQGLALFCIAGALAIGVLGTYAATGAAFDNPDFVDIVIHSYRHRYQAAPSDPAYEAIERRLALRPKIAAPTVVLHGAADGVDLPEQSAHDAAQFTGSYRREVVPVAGHFFPREAPQMVAYAFLELIAQTR